jgi:hypothetical protein
VVRAATLRVRASAPAGRAVVALRSVRPTRWRQNTLDWRHQPKRGRVVDRVTRFAKGAWVSLDATRLVRAARHGRVTMALAVSSRSGSTNFRSREARSGQPRLVVRAAASPVPPGGPGSQPPGPTPTAGPTSPGDSVVTVAGDIAGTNDEATAALVEGINPEVALTVGDNAYPSGTLSEYMSNYDPSWGRFKAKTRPTPGNHEYHSTNAQGYYDYFNGAGQPDGPAGPSGKGYYSFNLGSWHLIALNPHVSASTGSTQEQWLRQDLATNGGHCTLAFWHEPRFTSGAEHSNDTSVAPFWQDLYTAKADLVLNGHNHQYERFAPQNPNGTADPANGIREFVVGTGGAGLYDFASPQPNSEVRNATTQGVLKLTLHQGSYDWKFVPVAGQSFTDSGTATCHS